MTVQRRQRSAGIGGTYRMTETPEKNNFTSNVHLPQSNSAYVHFPQSNTANVYFPQTNRVGVSGVVAPQNVYTGLRTPSEGTGTSIEAPSHDSGPSHNEDSGSSRFDADDEQPLLP